MNVIFLDFDGVLDTYHFMKSDDIERRIKILSKICMETGSKVVIEASAKRCIDEETLEVEDDVKWVKKIFENFNKYNIECIGRTPEVGRKISEFSYTPIWKEDEIKLYLSRHPEIDHFCIIDDDDMGPKNSDLKTLKDYLVVTLNYSDNPEEEGLLESHLDQIKDILKKENIYKNSSIKKYKK